MARVEPVEYDRLDEEQKRVFKAIAGPREGNVGGPYTVWIHQPAIAKVMNDVGDVLRVNGKLDKRLMELMVLMMSHAWRCDYQWAVHEKAALNAGLSAETVAAIREGRQPEFERDDERIVHATVAELLETRFLSDAAYDVALQALGLELLVELVTNAGRYTQAAMVINAFAITKPGSAPVFTKR